MVFGFGGTSASAKASFLEEWQQATDDPEAKPRIAQAVQACIDGKASLSLSESGITNLPGSFALLQKKLAQLALPSNKLTALPPSLGMLKTLTMLVANSNQISSLANEIFAGCTSLQVLLLHDNKLTELPSSIGQLKRVHTLTLTYNDLKAIPSTFHELESLTKLSLSHNQLWPDSLAVLAQLPAIKQLALTNNLLQSLPAAWVAPGAKWVASLEELDVHENSLISLPDGIGTFRALKKLDVSNNRLMALPPSICDIESLASIDVDKNPLHRPPLTVCNRGIVAIRRYAPARRLRNLPRCVPMCYL